MRPRLTAVRVLGLVWVLFVVACRSERGERGDPTSRSPNSVPTGEAHRWLPIAFDEELRIGDSKGSDPDVELGVLTAVAVDARGNIYALERWDYRIRVYSPDGMPLRVIGREGSGPGEFREPTGLVFLGDSELVVSDRLLARLTVLSVRGDVRRTFRVPVPAWSMGTPIELAVVDDTTLLLRTDMGYSMPPRPDRDGLGMILRLRLHRGTAVVGVDTVLSFAETPYMLVRPKRPPWLLFFPRAFAPGPAWSVGPHGSFAFGRGARYSIGEYDPDGRELRRLERATPARRVTARDVAEFRETYPGGGFLSGLDSLTRSLAVAILDTLTIPDSFPAFDALRYDRAGRLWVRRPPGLDREAEWDVFDRELSYSGSVLLPAKIRVRVITDSHLYATEKTEGGATAIVRYRLLQRSR